MHECGQDTRWETKISGPPGTAEVSVSPGPETKSRRNKKEENQHNSSPAILHKNKSRRDDATYSPGEERKGRNKTREHYHLRWGQSFKGNTLTGNHLHSQPREQPETFPAKIHKTRHEPEKGTETSWLFAHEGWWGPWATPFFWEAIPGDQRAEGSTNPPLWEPPPKRKKQVST